MTNEERIKADAWAEAESKCGEDATPYRSGHFYGYIAGATAEHDRVQGELKEAQDTAKVFCNKHNETATQLAELVDRAQLLVATALEEIDHELEHRQGGTFLGMSPHQQQIIYNLAHKAIEQWKGTGKEETKPEPEGCPYCGSATCTSDHK